MNPLFHFAVALIVTLLALNANAASSSSKRSAQEQDASFSSRLKGVKAWQKEQQGKQQIAAYLYEAHLHDLMLDAPYHVKARQKALRKALRKANVNKRKTITKAQTLDAARTSLYKRAQKNRAFTPKDAALIEALKERKSVYRALGDRWAERHASISIASRLIKKAATQNEKAALSKAVVHLKSALSKIGKRRDNKVLKEKALRLYAKVFALKHNASRAALYSMRADRASASIKDDAKTTQNDYTRSRQTMNYCAEERTTCARLEKKSFKTPSYYDFSQETQARVFDEEAAEKTRMMYEPLVQACLAKHKKLARHERVELNWSVANDGKVSRSEVWRPKRLRKSALEKCVQKAFARFRYRPYLGPLKTLGLEYEL